MKPHMSGRVSFADFVLDRDTRELRRGAAVVPLSPKAFRLLELLVEHQPHAMAKGVLQDLLWPNTVVVEKNLANLVAEIRVALGDSAEQSRFVRTVPRFGYAFRDLAASIPAGNVRPALPQAPRYRVTWEGGRAALGDGDHIVGRDADVELFVDSPSVSRRHALIRVSGSQATLEDLDSKNGTFIGSRRIDALTPLADGDAINVGAITLRFKVVHAQGDTETW